MGFLKKGFRKQKFDAYKQAKLDLMNYSKMQSGLETLAKFVSSVIILEGMTIIPSIEEISDSLTIAGEELGIDMKKKDRDTAIPHIIAYLKAHGLKIEEDNEVKSDNN